MNLYEYVYRHVEANPTEPAIKQLSGPDVSYRELDRRAKRVAAWLEQHGVDEGERVGVYLPDCPSYVPLILGAWRAGCVATPLNTRFGVSDLTFVLEDVGPQVLFTNPAFAEETATLAAEVDPLEHVVEIDLDSELDDFPDENRAPETVTRLDSDIAIVMHTSGTTGMPKGVIQTHRNIGAQVDAGIQIFEYGPHTTSLAATPLFHVGGWHGATLMSLFAGGSLAVLPEWDAEAWAKTIEATDATFTGLVPTMMVDVLRTPAVEDYDTSSLETCSYGGSPAPQSLLNEFSETLDVDLANYYGQTENSGVSVTHAPDEDTPEGALGKPIQTVEAKIVDIESGEEVAPGERGELLLRGDNITQGYWERPERNEALFTDGWLHTEDVVRRDDDGYLYYVDRKDDIIHSGGEKVPPSKVEDVLQDAPSVESVAVFGTEHDRLGEAVTAAVVPTDDAVSKADVEAFCDDRDDLPGYMKPRRTVFVEEFPRTGSQKIDKVALAERIKE